MEIICVLIFMELLFIACLLYLCFATNKRWREVKGELEFSYKIQEYLAEHITLAMENYSLDKRK